MPPRCSKKTLLELAIDADYVLDMHCDAEAVVHLYTHTLSSDELAPLAALLGARAVLVAEISGDDPFDEACSRPWAELAGQFPGSPDPHGLPRHDAGISGRDGCDRRLAAPDAAALVAFLTLRGRDLRAGARTFPTALCEATPLAGSEPVIAPASGMVIFRKNVGDAIKAGDVVADIVDPLTGDAVQAASATDGVMFARILLRFASDGPAHRQGGGQDEHPHGQASGRLRPKKKGRLDGRPFHCRVRGPVDRPFSCVTHRSRQRPGSRSRKPGTAGYDNETLDHLLFVVDGEVQYGLKPRIT